MTDRGFAPYTNESTPGELYRDTETNEIWQAVAWVKPAVILINRRTGKKRVEPIFDPKSERFVAEGRAEL